MSVRSRTPSGPKWLLNERAALAGKVAKLAEVAEHHARRLAAAQERLASMDRTLELVFETPLERKNFVHHSLGNRLRRPDGKRHAQGARHLVSHSLHFFSAAPHPPTGEEPDTALRGCFIGVALHTSISQVGHRHRVERMYKKKPPGHITVFCPGRRIEEWFSWRIANQERLSSSRRLVPGEGRIADSST